MSEVEVIHDDQINVIYSDGTEQIKDLPENMRQVAYQVQQWVKTVGESGVSSMLDRRRWENTENPIEHFAHAHHLLRTSDLVSGFHELTEGVAFQGVKWESADADITDLFNQMAAEQNLDEAVRKLYRETYACSQVTVGLWWDQGEFKVRGVTKAGNARKKSYTVWYPRIITVLDPRRVVPVGMLAFGQEMLAWQATPEEMAYFQSYQRGDLAGDEVVRRFYLAKYEPSQAERLELDKIGVQSENLILLDPNLVRRHTLTRSDYERYAPVRLRSVFQLHDLRQQLMEADRVALVGAANYILLVKKGDKDAPATQGEVDNVRAGFRTLAKVPVIFSDHRLSIEIVTPKQDFTLTAEKYDLIDSRIIQRLISTVVGSRADRNTSDISIGKTVTRSLENRRHMLGRFLEVILAREVVRHPRNQEAWGAEPRQAPSLVYTPSNISIGDESSIAQQIISLRTMREISRESTLEYFGLDQEAEALRMKVEELFYDDTFKSQVPFSANGQPGGQGDGQDQGGGEGEPPAAQAPAGSRGGRPKGGGQRTQNPTKTSVTDSGNSSTKGQ